MVLSRPQLRLSPDCHQLANGVTVVVEQMPVEAVNFSLWIGAGSAVEPDSLNGMAHFLEHMVFKGGDSLAPGVFEQQVEQCGGVTNAMTSQDYTCFYVTTAPQDFAAVAPLQLEIVLDAMIPDAEFEREQQVVLEEIRRTDDSPGRRVFNQAMQLAFDSLPYRRPVLGPAAGVAALTPSQMRQFHAQWYAPQYLTAVVVGNVPTDQMMATLLPKLERLVQSEATALPPSPALHPEPSFTGIHREVYQDQQLKDARLVLLWRVPGLAQVEQTDPLDVVARILGTGRTARLVQDLRETRQWVTHISASNLTYRCQGLFWISVQLETAAIPKVEQAILEHLQRLQTDLVEPEELDQVKRQTVNRHIFSSETPASRAGLYGYAQAIAGNVDHSLDYALRIQAIGREAVRDAAQQFLSVTGYRTLVLHP